MFSISIKTRTYAPLDSRPTVSFIDHIVQEKLFAQTTKIKLKIIETNFSIREGPKSLRVKFHYLFLEVQNP